MSLPVSFGRYRVTGELGRGGMGIVYRAHDPELERDVAVKLIALPVDASRELRDELERRFRREAKAAARIRHPGVVAIHDVGVTEHGLYLVMEMVDGESLSRRLERGDFPDRAAAIELVARAADALAAAHDAGVVHRDVKPANILLGGDGRVMLTDFGVARSLDEMSELTRTGMVVGSPAYMAPEQLQGAPVDGRADLFSLGVVLYELLLHKRPFPAQSITTLLYQILHEDPLADPAILRDLDAPTAALLRRMLAKSPDARYPDARATAAALRALPFAAPGSEAPTVRRFVPPPPPPPPAATLPAGATTSPTVARVTAATVVRRRSHLPLVLLGVLLAVAALVGAALVAWWNWPPARPPVVQPEASGAWKPGAGPLPEAVVPAAAPTPTPVTVILGAVVTPAPRPTATPAPSLAARAEPAESPAPVRPPAVDEKPAAPRVEPLLMRVRCRKGVSLNVDPDDTEVWVDGKDVGNADDNDDVDFSTPGWHVVQLVYAGYRPVTVQVEVSPDADDRRADVNVDMQKLP